MTLDNRIATQESLAQHFNDKVLALTGRAFLLVFIPTTKQAKASMTLLPAAEGLRLGKEWNRLSPALRGERLGAARVAAEDEVTLCDNPLKIPEIDELDKQYRTAYQRLKDLTQLAATNTPSSLREEIKQTAKVTIGLFILYLGMIYVSKPLGLLILLASFLSIVVVPVMRRSKRAQRDAHADKVYQELKTAVTRVKRLSEEIVGIVLTKVSNGTLAGMAEAVPAVHSLYDELPVVGWRWDAPGWDEWEPVTMRPGVTRVGELTYFIHYAREVESDAISLPFFERLFTQLRTTCAPIALERPTPNYIISRETPALTVPWLVPIPGGGNVVIKASGANSNQAMDALQSVMFRLLATVPPGKVRFTLIDPVGLGQNVASFMRLADYDEQLVTSRAWSEPRHIEQRLADLTEHIENVIQKYLRNDFATIEDYNEQANEVAEPYRVLVVMGFPTNFTDETAKRLVSIATNGPRCGVSVLVAIDESKPLPYGFNLWDLERVSSVIAQTQGDPAGRTFVWQHPEYRDVGHLQLDPLPPPALFNQIVQDVGERAKAANRVEVPFERIIPAPDQWWSGDSRDGIEIPLGRAGANKLQALELGKGTTHHALVVGRIGSGKSSLFHAAIMNAALLYSPHELELYLIDFKEGVEFKSYASHQLPNARVIAIESEREFGLSVLQGLSAEYHRRGALFRSLEVLNIADYRNKTGGRMPRVLLIVDEFQVLFGEDDIISRESSRLLAELVRLARAAGIHVLLGSQTLAGSAGASALSEAIKGQMSVRIALQSSDADARLILGDENPAARLLSRPGEAIYNTKNGLVEGNQLFQVAWLSDDRREHYLQQVHSLAQHYNYSPAGPPVVFEGNETADPRKNQALNDVLSSLPWTAPMRAVPVWLGEPIAIQSPTAAPFRRQGGSNLLIVGQDDEAALGILTTAVLSLAAHHQPLPGRESAGPRFCIFDLGQVDAPHAGLLKQVAELLPHPARVVGQRGVGEMLTNIAAEVHRRMQDDADTSAPLYLLVYGLQRAREIQQDDLFASGSGQGVATSPVQQFATILREGPDLGVHTLMWCDNLGNFERRLGRQSGREFDLRVAFQMGSDESSTFIDTPQASKLGSNRALFFSEDLGRIEKFRPYGVPPAEWLAWAGQRLRDKAAALPRQDDPGVRETPRQDEVVNQLQQLIDGAG